MKTRHVLILCGLLAVSAGGALAGCASSAGTISGSTGGAPKVTTTATAKPKPITAPVISLQSCQALMSLSEANQIMHAQTPATTILASPDDGKPVVGACHYVIAQPYTLLNIFFDNWAGPVPIPQQDLADAVKQLADDPTATIVSATTVSGVADQAAYVSFTMSPGGIPVLGSVFWVLDGKLLFNCYAVGPASSSAAQAGTQSNLQACATQVLSRL